MDDRIVYIGDQTVFIITDIQPFVKQIGSIDRITEIIYHQTDTDIIDQKLFAFLREHDHEVALIINIAQGEITPVTHFKHRIFKKMRRIELIQVFYMLKSRIFVSYIQHIGGGPQNRTSKTYMTTYREVIVIRQYRYLPVHEGIFYITVMKVLYVVNPISGGKDKSYFVNNINDYCYTYGIDYEFFYTSGQDDADKIRRRVTAYHPDRVFSIGGDGTFRDICTATKGMNIPVAYIPMGSANGMREDLPAGESPWESFEMLMATYFTKPLDIIRINGMDCMHVADVGLNAQLVKAYDQDKNRGILTYAKYLFGAVRAQETYRFRFTVDGKEYEKKGSMLAIANGTRYGSGLTFNTKGNPFDNQFEIIVIGRINLGAVVRAGWTKFFNEMNYDNYFSVSGRRAEIDISRVTTLQVDGEVGGRFDHLDIEMEEAKVPVLICRTPH